MGNYVAKPLLSIASERIGYKWCGGGLSGGRFYKNHHELPTREEYLYDVHDSLPLNRIDASCTVHDILYSIAAKMTQETVPQFTSTIKSMAEKFPDRPFYKYCIDDLQNGETDLKKIVKLISIAADKELLYHISYINSLHYSKRKLRSEKMVGKLIICSFWIKNTLGIVGVAINHGSFTTNDQGFSLELDHLVNLYDESYTIFNGIMRSQLSIPHMTCINRDRTITCSCMNDNSKHVTSSL